MALTFGENVSLLSERTDEAETDPLTGLGNRRRLMVDLDRAVHDQHGSTVLALFDLNGFKLNDTFGHPAGDELSPARRQLSLRAAEMSGRGYRMGGDEFCLLPRSAVALASPWSTMPFARSARRARYSRSPRRTGLSNSPPTRPTRRHDAARRPADVREQGVGEDVRRRAVNQRLARGTARA